MTETFKELWKSFEYFHDAWQQKLKNPGDDLITMLAHGDATKDMAPNEMLGNLLMLIVGGNDTIRNSISGGVYALNRFPDEYTKLKGDTSLIPNMVSEIIRYHTPIAHTARTATCDIDFYGHEIKEGDRVALWYISANRDEDVIERPNEFIIDRPDARNHLSFGHGIHHCVGNHLAEMQLAILWEEIEKRFDRIDTVAEPVRVRSSFANGIRELTTQISA